MFSFLRNWRQKRRMKALAAARAILPYWDGQQLHYGDPFAIFRLITQDAGTKGQPGINLERALPDVDAGKEPITTQVIDLICRAFQVQRWNTATQSGLTDLEIIGLLTLILAWREGVKKNSSPGPTSPEPTAPPSSTATEPPNSTTNASVDSTPT